MKKIIYSLFLFVLSISTIYAYTLPYEGYYMAPLSSSGINLRSAHYPSRDGIGSLVWHDEKGMQNASDGSQSIAIPPNEYTSFDSTRYYDKNIVISGGYALNNNNENENENVRKALRDGTVSIWVESDTGALEMVSQSNNAYKRPFELYLILKTKNTAHISGGENIIGVMKIAENMQVVESQMLKFLDDEEPEWWESWKKDPWDNGSAVFFDIILAFPDGEKWSENNTVLTSNGKTYYLAQRDDFSAMVTVHIEFKDKEGQSLGAVRSYTVPFSGYFSQEDKPQISKVSFSVNMFPSAYNLNLETDCNKEIPIASTNVIANYGKNATNLPRDMYLFLSSNNNPNIEGDRFRFEKLEKGLKPDVVTSENSLGFVLRMPDPNGTVKVFDGTGYFLRDSQLDNPISGDSIKIESTNTPLLHTGETGGQTTVTYYPYDGEISILIDEPPLEILEAGLYQEDVYIHIITRF